MSRRTLAVRLVALVVFVAIVIVIQIRVGLPDQAELRSLLDGLGKAAIPTFIALYVAVSLLPAGPSAVLTIVGGALLGFPVALASVLVAAVIGASIAFLLSRALGRDLVRRVSSEWLLSLDERVRERGFVTVLVARLVPVLPFTTLNYAFGITSVRWQSYVAATAIGIAPGTVLFVTVGAYGATPGSWPFVLAVAGLVALSLVGVVRARRVRRTVTDPSPD